jgi:hypothetical protein
MQEEKVTLLHGHWRSVVDAITEEYLYALGGCGEYQFDEQTSFHCARMTLRDKFMTHAQINYLYHQGALQTFRNRECKACRYTTPEIPCKETEAEVEKCWQIAQDKWYADAAAPFWMSEE